MDKFNTDVCNPDARLVPTSAGNSVDFDVNYDRVLYFYQDQQCSKIDKIIIDRDSAECAGYPTQNAGVNPNLACVVKDGRGVAETSCQNLHIHPYPDYQSCDATSSAPDSSSAPVTSSTGVNRPFDVPQGVGAGQFFRGQECTGTNTFVDFLYIGLCFFDDNSYAKLNVDGNVTTFHRYSPNDPTCCEFLFS